MARPLSRRALVASVPGVAIFRSAAAGTASGVPRVALTDLPRGSTLDLVQPGASWAAQLWGESVLTVGRDGNLVSGMASVVALSSDRTSLGISIRPDALFSDGSPVLSGDVAASLERAASRSLDAGLGWRFEHVGSIDVREPRTLVVTLAEPDASFPSTLASHVAPVLPEAWIRDSPDSGFPLASGGFERMSADGSTIECRRTTTFYQVGRPRLDGVTCLSPDGSMPRAMELVTGRCDVLIDVPNLDVPTLKENPGIVLVGGEANNLCHVAFNLQRPVVSDRRVRQVVAQVIDRPALAMAAAAGEATAADSLFPPDHWAAHDDPIDTVPADQARATLVDLGHRPGTRLRMLTSAQDPVLVNAAVTLQDQLAYAGLELEIDLIDSERLDAEVLAGTWDLLVRRTAHWRDPHELVRPLLVSGASENYSGYSSSRVDYLVDLARRARFQEYRGDLYRDIQQIIRTEVPIIPLLFPHYYDAMTTAIQGYPAFSPVSARAMYQATMIPVEPNATP